MTHSRSRRSQQQTVIDIAPVVLASWTKQRKGVRVELGSFRVDSRRGMGPFYRERGNVVCMFLSFVSFVLSFPFFFVIGKERERERIVIVRVTTRSCRAKWHTIRCSFVPATDAGTRLPWPVLSLSLSLSRLTDKHLQTCPRGKKENVSIRVVLTVRSFSDMPSWRNFWRKRSGHCPQLLWSVPFRILQYKVVTVPYRKRSYY